MICYWPYPVFKELWNLIGLIQLSLVGNAVYFFIVLTPDCLMLCCCTQSWAYLMSALRCPFLQLRHLTPTGKKKKNQSSVAHISDYNHWVLINLFYGFNYLCSSLKLLRMFYFFRYILLGQLLVNILSLSFFL